jgi:hypothetical protein
MTLQVSAGERTHSAPTCGPEGQLAFLAALSEAIGMTAFAASALSR